MCRILTNVRDLCLPTWLQNDFLTNRKCRIARQQIFLDERSSFRSRFTLDTLNPPVISFPPFARERSLSSETRSPFTIHRKNGRVSHRSCVSPRYFFRSIFHSPLYRRSFGSLSVTERVPRDTQPQRPG